ncbi:MAG: protein phosphatase [Oscillospiraceae bacterium]|jgi:predicted transcriptional regulator|nr:protein phosphatase [Oscillospiraceae bacterium]
MPNSAEMIEQLAKQLERHIILEMAQECETLEELIEKLKAVIRSNSGK